MCVAIVKPSGANLPSREILKICFKNNPDGAGFAFNRKGKNYIKKGFFTFSDFYNNLIKCKITKKESALIHFRVATHGNIDKQTCHPFVITDKYNDMKIIDAHTNGNVLIHNGQLYFNREDDEISDSMVLAKQLYNIDLKKSENKKFLELALLNNDKTKLNRVGILFLDNTTEIFGFKEPWELVNGCYFSNKSYEKTFSRMKYSYNYKNGNNEKESEIENKFNYDENEIQSSKVSFCKNRNNGCDDLGCYFVHSSIKDIDCYCENCISDVDYFNCKYCDKTYYTNQMSEIKNMCCDCYEKNKDFLMHENCCKCNSIAKKTVYTNDNQVEYFCHQCFNKLETFICNECGKIHLLIDQSKNITGLCVACEKKQLNKECLYCKTKNNLMRTSFSVVCKKCFNERKGKKCFLCGKNFLYGGNSIGSLCFCSKCSDNKFSISSVLNKFKSFVLLNNNDKNEILTKINNTPENIKEKIIKIYKNNDYYQNIKSNYICSKSLLNESKNYKLKELTK